MTSEQEVLETVEIAIEQIINEVSFAYDLDAVPTWSKFPVRLRIRKDAVPEGLVDAINKMAMPKEEREQMRNQNLDQRIPTIVKKAVLKRGNQKQNQNDLTKPWAFFWDIKELVPSETLGIPHRGAPVSTPTPSGSPAPHKVTTAEEARRTGVEEQQFRTDVRTALMQANEYSISYNQHMSGNAEIMLNVGDVLKIADDYLGWIKSNLAAIPPISPLVEHAESLGAEVTSVTEIDEMPNLYTKKDVVEYLTQDQKMTLDEMAALLRDAGYRDSNDYYQKNGGDTPQTNTNLAKAILRLKKSNEVDGSGNLPW